jgi:oligopeptide transport system permease protein
MFALVVGVPCGIISALNQNRWQDNVIMAIAIIGVSVPSFVMATLLMYVFAVKLRWLPAAMWGTPKHVISAHAGAGRVPYCFLCAADAIQHPGCSVAGLHPHSRSKGLSWAAVVYKHVIKNAILPVVTYLGPLGCRDSHRELRG